MNSPDELLHYLHGGWPSTKKHTALRSKVEKVRIDSLLESAEIINTRMSMLETWGDAEYDKYCKDNGLSGNGGSDLESSYDKDVVELADSYTPS